MNIYIYMLKWLARLREVEPGFCLPPQLGLLVLSAPTVDVLHTETASSPFSVVLHIFSSVLLVSSARHHGIDQWSCILSSSALRKFRF